MEREQFMSQLERLLSDISESERREALDYYEGYFDDAGPEQEAAVIRELGSPGKVAAIIKADLEESNDRYAQYTEWGYEDTRRKEPGEVPDKYTAVVVSGGDPEGKDSGGASGDSTEQEDGNGSRDFGSAREERRQERRRARENRYGERGSGRTSQWNRDTQSESGRNSGYGTEGEPGQEGRGSRRERGYHANRRKNNATIILILILLVFVSPLIKGTVGGILGLLLLLVLFPLVLVLLFGSIAIALTVGGIGVVLRGIASCIGNPAVGVLRVGVGCILVAVGILCILLTVWAACRILPRWIRGFTDFCQRIFNGRKKGDET